VNGPKKWEDCVKRQFYPQKHHRAEIEGKEPEREMAVFMEGFKKRVKGGPLEFGIKVPSVP
jgi:hypothetical protein